MTSFGRVFTLGYVSEHVIKYVCNYSNVIEYIINYNTKL